MTTTTGLDAPSLRSATCVRTDRDQLAHLARWARAALPGEACGCLLGRLVGSTFTLVRVRRARNRSVRPERFELDPGDVVRAADEAAARELALGGIWHSHALAPARPSPHDRPDAWPGALHLVVSLAGVEPEVTAWRARGGALEPIALHVAASER